MFAYTKYIKLARIICTSSFRVYPKELKYIGRVQGLWLTEPRLNREVITYGLLRRGGKKPCQNVVVVILPI